MTYIANVPKTPEQIAENEALQKEKEAKEKKAKAKKKE
jgi:hypothetical protein